MPMTIMSSTYTKKYLIAEFLEYTDKEESGEEHVDPFSMTYPVSQWYHAEEDCFRPYKDSWS